MVMEHVFVTNANVMLSKMATTLKKIIAKSSKLLALSMKHVLDVSMNLSTATRLLWTKTAPLNAPLKTITI